MLYGTAITCLCTHEFIVVGSDSKIVRIGDDGPHLVEQKIHQVDNLFFASAGLLQDAIGTFNIADTIRKVRGRGGSIKETADLFEREIIAPMRSMTLYIKQTQPDFFKDKIEGKFISEVLLFGIEETSPSRIPVVHSRRFNAQMTVGHLNINVVRTSYPMAGGSTAFFYAFGEFQAINDYLDRTP